MRSSVAALKKPRQRSVMLVSDVRVSNVLTAISGQMWPLQQLSASVGERHFTQVSMSGLNLGLRNNLPTPSASKLHKRLRD